MLDKFLSKKRNVFLLVVVAILLESLTSPFLKLGGRYPFLSAKYILWFAAAVIILAFYAVCWQLVLERIPLTTAYLRKGISYILVFVWAKVIFGESISLQQIIGMMVIVMGMVVSISDEHK